jgi:hypothetical protein
MSTSVTAHFIATTHSPCEIIGSIVKQWPGFITPTALFSEKQKHSCSVGTHATCSFRLRASNASKAIDSWDDWQGQIINHRTVICFLFNRWQCCQPSAQAIPLVLCKMGLSQYNCVWLQPFLPSTEHTAPNNKQKILCFHSSKISNCGDLDYDIMGTYRW